VRLEGLLRRDGAGWLGVVQLVGLQNAAAVRAAIVAGNFKTVQFVDVRQVSTTVMREIREEALVRMGIGGAVIVVVLLLVLRSASRSMLILFTIVATLIVSIAMLCIVGERLTIFHQLALLLVAGICIDYGLFLTRPDATADYGRTLQSIFICALSTTLVFSLLASSAVPVLHMLGLTVVIGVVTGFIFTVSGLGIAHT